MSADIDQWIADVVTRVTAAGGPCELGREQAAGREQTVFTGRAPTLAHLVRDSARHDAREYLVCGQQRVTYSDNLATVAAIAQALRDKGIGKGDRVAIYAANSPQWVQVFLATVCVGAVGVGLNAWWTGAEARHGLDLTTPKLVFADEKRAARLPSDLGLPVYSIESDLPGLVAGAAGAALPDPDSLGLDQQDPAAILFTSGTSGRAKGVVHSHFAMSNVVEYQRFGDRMLVEFGDAGDQRDRRFLLLMPLFHIGGLHNLVIPRMETGCTIVMNPGRFDPDVVLKLIETERITNLAAVPTMATRILEHGHLDSHDLSSLKAFALASAPSSPQLKARLASELPGPQLADSFGMTETGTAVTVASALDVAVSPGSVGKPIVCVEMKIIGPDGETLPDGQEGEVCARSCYQMSGYWNDPQGTAATIDPQGWLHTGDIGSIEGGRLTLTARRTDLILRGGENVYPVEVENRLSEHPAVGECAVLGVEHPDLGQEVMAVVVLRDGCHVETQELCDFLAESLAAFKVPSRWKIHSESLPRTATGKIQRRLIDTR